MSPEQLWAFFPLGYAFSVLLETPVLLVGLSARHPIRHRLFAGVWLTACTYPIVVLVLPWFFDPVESRAAYLWVAETFAPAAECLLFWAAFGKRELLGTASMWCDFGAITLANVFSFLAGEWMNTAGWPFIR
jgi:hypothetical protein